LYLALDCPSTVRVGKQNSSHCNVAYDPVRKQQEEEIERSKRTFEADGQHLELARAPSRQPIRQGFGFLWAIVSIASRNNGTGRNGTKNLRNSGCINCGKKSQICSIKKLLYKFIGKFPGTPRIVEFIKESFQGQIQTGLKFRKIRLHTPPEMSGS